MLRLGRVFQLQDPFARGGMGEVWRGLHLPSGSTVAVKLARGDSATDPVFAAHFRSEVHSAAALDHPGVIRLFDCGEVDGELAQASDGRLVEGTPWMAMEWASAGTLRSVQLTGWSHYRRVLLELLDALAHAHARGVIHRDIKPSNVVICGDEAPRPGLKLADFGIAAPREAEASWGAVGTRNYAAPEQLENRFRDQGPWTDLYSVGCVALVKATGAWRVPDPDERLITRFAVPGGFEEWIRRLTAYDVGLRWAFAADAARALVALGDPTTGDMESAVSPGGTPACELRTLTDLGVAADPFSSTTETAPPPSVPAAPGIEPQAVAADRPAFVTDWRRPDPPPPPAWLEGVGLGLFGLRSPPFVNRDAQREVAWGALHDVVASGRAQALVVTGPPGSGKSRFAAWLVERAHELGMAHPFTLPRGPESSPRGLAPMVARKLRCQGLPRAEASLRIGSSLRALGCDDTSEVAELCEFVSPATDSDIAGGSTVVRLDSAVERFAVVRRYLSGVARTRAAVLWIDDPRPGSEALGFVEALLAAQYDDPAPILVIVTAEKDTDGLLALADAREIPLDPLAKGDFTHLVRGLLGLTPRHVARVQALSGGNPLHAVHLVGEWVASGLLEIEEGGFVVGEGETAHAYDDLFGARLATADPSSSEALEVAAALGLYVAGDEWERACAGCDLSADVGAVDALAAAGLARREAGGFSFTHAGVRDALGRRAEGRGRRRRHHAACARALEADDTVDTLERRAEHLIASGDVEAAFEPLDRAIGLRLTAGDQRLAESYLALRSETVESLGLPADDVRRARGAVLQARLLALLGRVDDADRALERWLAELPRLRDDAIYVDLLNVAARIARIRGDNTRAREQLREAHRAADARGDRALRAEIRRLLGDVALAQGDLEGAAESYTESARDYEACGDNRGLAGCMRGHAHVARAGGDQARAGALLDESRSLFRKVGDRAGVAGVANDRADIARLCGELDAAERGYRESLRLFRATESTFAVYAEINLGLLLIERERHREADEIMGKVALRCEREGLQELGAIVHVGRLACTAALGAWALLDSCAARTEELLSRTGLVDVDAARLATSAARRCHDAGEMERAARCSRIAASQWQALGRTDEVEALRRDAG